MVFLFLFNTKTQHGVDNTGRYKTCKPGEWAQLTLVIIGNEGIYDMIDRFQWSNAHNEKA